jgi:hypothetical protein
LSKSSDLRSAVIAAGASVAVGILTFFSSSCNTQAQINQADLGHYKDIAQAFEAEAPELFNADEPHVQVALATIYFLGQNESERRQIILTAGSSRTSSMRVAISKILLLDQSIGSQLAQDSEVQQVVESPTPTPSPRPKSSPRLGAKSSPIPAPTGTPSSPESPAHWDRLDETFALLNGYGWIFAGLGPRGRPTAELGPDRSFPNTVVPSEGTLLTLSRNVNVRSTPSPDGDRIGVVPAGTKVVVLGVSSHQVPGANELAYWIQVFLCGAPTSVKKPLQAASCPQAP